MNEAIILDKHKAVTWTNKRFNITLITGDPGCGKSVLAKIIASEIWNKRRILIIDPKGDWVMRGKTEYGVRQFNRKNLWRGKRAACINAHLIENFKLKIQDFGRESLIALGFTPPGAEFLVNTMRNYETIWQYDVNLLIRFMELYPTTKKELKTWNETNNTRINIEARSDVKQSVLSRLTYIKNWFWQGGDKDINFAYELKRNNLIIQPIQEIKQDERQLRAYFGVIMKKMERAIKEINPLIIIDETDKLCPNPMNLDQIEKQNPLPITLWLVNFVFKEARMNSVSFIFITQRKDMLHYQLVEQLDYWITGHIRGIEGLENLEYNLERGIRQFYIEDVRNNLKLVFIPKEPGMEC